MITGLASSLIATALIELVKKVVPVMFRREDIANWMESPDFAELIREKSPFEIPPEPVFDSAALNKILLSEKGPLIIEIVWAVFEPNDRTLSELEEEFIAAFEGCIPAPESLNPEFVPWLFSILTISLEELLSEKAKEGDPSAEEHLHEFRHKKELLGQKEIAKKVDGIQKSVTELQQLAEHSSGSQTEKFVQWREYFQHAEQHLLPLSAGSRLQQTVYHLEIAETFLSDDYERILILHAPGGSGKSHLLRQIAFDLEKKYLEYTILSITPRFLNLEDALSGELDSDKQYLLLFDDVDRWDEELAPLFAYVKYRSSNVKIILTARTIGLRNIQNTLENLSCRDLAQVTEIKDWDADDLKELLRFALDGKHHRQEELIVARIQNPYLIVQFGKIITKEPGFEIERLQQKIVADIESAASQSLAPELNINAIKPFLADLALICPLNKSDKTISSLLAEKHGTTEDQVQTYISLLMECGVLREVGFSIRFNPDINGDLYLAHFIDQLHDSDVLDRWIDSWGPAFNATILKNLEAPLGIYKGDIIKRYFSAWVCKAIETAKTTSSRDRGVHLESLSWFCHLIPDDSVDLMCAYIRNPPEDEGDSIFSVSQDTYGAVVLSLIHAGHKRDEIFDLLGHIYESVPEGQYSNYKIESLISETVSPVYNDKDGVQETLTLLEGRLDADNPFTIIALSEALSGALKTVHEMTYQSAPYKMTLSTLTLPATFPVLETRKHAISILKRMLCHQSVQVRRKAIEISKGIGHQPGGEKSPLLERVAEERGIVLAELERLIPCETDYRVLSDIENLLFWWWQYKFPGTDGVERVLSAFPRPTEYVLNGFLFYARPMLLTFDPATIPSEESERDLWYLSVESGFTASESVFADFCEHLTNNLSTTYSDTSSVIALLQNLQTHREHVNVDSQQLNSIFSSWVAKNPDIFFGLRNQEQIWHELSIEFKNAIDLGLCNYDPRHLESLVDEMLVAPQDVDSRRVEGVISVMIRYPLDEGRTIDCVAKLIDIGKKEMHLTLLYNLWRMSQSLGNHEFFVTSYLTIFSHYEAMDKELIRCFMYMLPALTEAEDHLEDRQIDAIKKCLREKLISIPSLESCPEYETQTLINYILTDTENTLNFIHERAEKKRYAHDYRIIPLYRISLLKNVDDCAGLCLILDDLLVFMNEELIDREQLFFQLRAVTSVKHQVTRKLCLEEYAKQLLNKGRIDDALTLCHTLLLQPQTEETILKILDGAVAAGRKKDIRRMFWNYTWCDAFSFAEGRSPELDHKREVIAHLLSLAPPGGLRATLREELDLIDGRVQTIKKEHEEDLVTRW